MLSCRKLSYDGNKWHPNLVSGFGVVTDITPKHTDTSEYSVYFNTNIMLFERHLSQVRNEKDCKT